MQERDRKKRAQCAAQDPGRELGWHAAPLPLSPSHTTHSDTGYTKISGLTAKIFHCSQTQPHSATESCVGSHIRVRKYHPCKYISNLSNYFYRVDTLNKLKGSTLVRRSTLQLHYIFRRALNLYSFYFVRKCLECFSHALTISCQGTMYVNCICRNSLTSAAACFKPRTHIFLHFRTTDFRFSFRHIFSNHIRKVQSLICTFGGVFFWDLEKVVANTLTSDWKKTNDSKK